MGTEDVKEKILLCKVKLLLYQIFKKQNMISLPYRVYMTRNYGSVLNLSKTLFHKEIKHTKLWPLPHRNFVKEVEE